VRLDTKFIVGKSSCILAAALTSHGKGEVRPGSPEGTSPTVTSEQGGSSSFARYLMKTCPPLQIGFLSRRFGHTEQGTWHVQVHVEYIYKLYIASARRVYVSAVASSSNNSCSGKWKPRQNLRLSCLV
jgi:hypothetical protein